MANYIKLEYKDGSPTIGIIYDDSLIFRELIITLFSPSSCQVFYETIRNMMVQNNADEEDIIWLDNFYKMLEKIDEDKLLIKQPRTLMRPSSFR